MRRFSYFINNYVTCNNMEHQYTEIINNADLLETDNIIYTFRLNIYNKILKYSTRYVFRPEILN